MNNAMFLLDLKKGVAPLPHYVGRKEIVDKKLKLSIHSQHRKQEIHQNSDNEILYVTTADFQHRSFAICGETRYSPQPCSLIVSCTSLIIAENIQYCQLRHEQNHIAYKSEDVTSGDQLTLAGLRP